MDRAATTILRGRRRRWLVAICALLVVLPMGLAFGGGAMPTVAATGDLQVKINQGFSATFRFDPASITVPRGERVAFPNLTRFGEMHTVTIARAAQLPVTLREVFTCGGPRTACAPAIGHFDENFNPISGRQRLNAGRRGLDTRGDSLLMMPRGGSADPISAVVSAPVGTELHFVCAVHPWMQGSISVR